MANKPFNQIEYQNEYNRQNYDRINLVVKKGKKDIIKAEAQKSGKKVNEYINNAIDEYIKKQNDEI
jgi:predicted HicB family RNase H-like nuclease